MSTRCMVRITSSGLGWDEAPQYLYHHCDGYPENILPLINKAFVVGTEGMGALRGFPADWELGRAGKVAGLLCAVDPLQFEPDPEANSRGDAPYHGDLDFVYHVHLVNKTNPKDRGAIRWLVTVFQTKPEFWDAPTNKNLKQVGPKMKLTPGKPVTLG